MSQEVPRGSADTAVSSPLPCLEQEAVLDRLLSDPGQSCWVLDGYDEFHRRLNSPVELPDPETPLPAADLVSALLTRRLLPGSTVLLTCRDRDVPDLDGSEDKVGQLLPWDHQQIREHVDGFFAANGKNPLVEVKIPAGLPETKTGFCLEGDGSDGRLGSEAADLLFSSRHLLALSSLPALCNICCVFLQRLLRGKRQTQEEERGGRPDVERRNDPNGAETSEIPRTLTQLYLAVVAAFLSRGGGGGGGGVDDRMHTSPSQR